MNRGLSRSLGPCCLLAFIAAGCVGGCASSGGAASGDGMSTGLSALTDPSRDPALHLPKPIEAGEVAPAAAQDLAALAEKAALDLERALNEINVAAAAQESPAPDPEPVVPEVPSPAPAEVAAAEPAPSAGGADPVSEVAPGAAPPVEPVVVLPPKPNPMENLKSPEEQITEAAATIVALLRERAKTSESPVREYLLLALMESLRPGVAADPTTGGMVEGSNILLPSEWESVQAFRDLALEITRGGVGDAGTLVDLFLDAADGLSDRIPLKIAAAKLCTRVTGYGQYVPIEPARFVAGRAQKLIVYTEIEHFRNRPIGAGDRREDSARSASGGDLFAVEVSQELNLYRDTGSQLVLRRPEQTILETSRNRRREFYLVHEITLPTTLTVGLYRLKVTMRDKTSGAVDEAIIPIEIVADPGLVRGAGGANFD